MRLNEISDNQGATPSRTRVGRGIGSGKGKTGGRGVKGQKSRSGVAIKGYEGGQMPIHMRLPKRGFNNPFALKLNAVRLDRIQAAIDAKKLDIKNPVTAQSLVDAGVIRRAKDGVRLIQGHQDFKAKSVTFQVVHASKGATAAIEKAGGKVEVLEAKSENAK